MNETTRSEKSTVFHDLRVRIQGFVLFALVAQSAASAGGLGNVGGLGSKAQQAGGATPAEPPAPPGDPWIPPEPFDPYGIPDGGGKTFGRTVAGRFNDDDMLDVALLADGEVLFLSGRDLYLSHDTPWSNVIDLDTYPAGGPDGQDAVVFTDASGLHLGWWDFATKAFVRTQVDGSAWAGAKLVRAAGVRGVLRSDVSGVSADGRTLLVMGVVSEAPLSFAPVPGASFTLANDILSFTVVEWDGVALAEWVLLTTAPLQVYDAGGNLVESWATAGMGGWLATLDHEYLPYDRFVWLTAEVPAGQGVAQWIFTVDDAHVDPAVNVAGVKATSIVAGDWDRDGDDDIAIGHQFGQQLYLASNERSSAAPEAISFPSGGLVELLAVGNPNEPNPGHVANPVIGDFDGDGDPDLGTAVQASVEFRIAVNSDVDDDAQEPVILDMQYVVIEDARSGELTIEIDRDASMIEPITDVRVTIWRQGVLGEPSDPAPVDDVIFPIGQWPSEITVLVPEPGHYFESVFYFEMRFLERDASGGIVASYSASLGGLTLSPLIYDILVLVEGAGPKLELIPEGYLFFPPGGSGVLAGAYVPNLRVPESVGMNYE